jgi:hypothetical protein
MEQTGSEWTIVEQGGSGSSDPRAWELVDEIRANLQGWQPTTEDEQVLYSQGLDQIQDLADARRLRLVEAGEHLPNPSCPLQALNREGQQEAHDL